MQKRLLVVLIVSCSISSSCKKEDEAVVSSTTKTLNLSNIQGTLEATTFRFVYDSVGTRFTDPLGSAWAQFKPSNTATTFQASVGKVTCENIDLPFDTIYGYSNSLNTQNPIISITFSGNVDWTISGSAIHSSFAVSPMMGFPYIAAPKADSIIRINQDFTLSTDTILNADSVTYELMAIKQTYPGNILSHTFTKAELNVNGPGDRPRSHFATISAFTHDVLRINGNDYYFVNRNRITKVVKTL